MSILNQTSIVYVPQSYSVDSRTPIVAEVWAADDTDLPAATAFDGYNLCVGSKVTCANGDIYRFDGTQWVYNDTNPFADVYTKSEIDTILSDYYTESEVDTLFTDYYTKSEVDSLILSARDYCLLIDSPLNLISVTAGTSTGYFVENLAIDLPAGTYTWKMQRDGNTTTSMRVKAADDTSLYNVTRGAGVNDITQEFTISDTGAKISIYTGAGVNVWGCLIYKTG